MQNNFNMSPFIYPVHVAAVEVIIVVTFVTIVIAAGYMVWTILDWLFGKLAAREESKVRDRFRRIRKYNRI